jgi:hypothetical protein
MTDQQPRNIWGEICRRAGIEFADPNDPKSEGRDPEDTGPPTHIGMAILFAWHPTKDDPNNINPACSLPHATRPTVFQVGKPVPLKPTFQVLAIFDDGISPTVRVYAMHSCMVDPKVQRPEKIEEIIPLRWTLTRTTTTMSCAHFPDPETFFDTIAAEIIAAEEELEDVLDPDEGPPPPLPVPS